MKIESIQWNGKKIQVYSLHTVIVGSGAAGLSAAERLFALGQTDISVVTEGLYMGTSRNTGSDKQTYYKLTLAGGQQDSVLDMATTLYNGGSMHGDIALVEAALSAQCFYHLADIGVPFPHNEFGEYVGYKTDHDPRQRATSAGPLTSQYMTERLQEQVVRKGIQIFDGYQVLAVLTDAEKTRSIGLLTLNLHHLSDAHERYVIFNCSNIIYATGGPAGIYQDSVYPESQIGATGAALEAGARGRNLTEWQYGIASIGFRWNLSGTYQQVLPRYISTEADGSDEREFLEPYFEDPGKMLDAIFLKGYQWPFDSRKLGEHGSSLIDILVYQERVIKGRRVFLDYTRNPQSPCKSGELDFSLLGEESYAYLNSSGALFGTPIQRLGHMNQPAVELYQNHGIDLSTEYLEIAVCAQHNNGGLAGDLWWESNLKHFFPIGEVSGTHGIYRPGGSALNAGQVGARRAAQYIAEKYPEEPIAAGELLKAASQQIDDKIQMGERFLQNLQGDLHPREIRRRICKKMTEAGAQMRSLGHIRKAAACLHDLQKNLCTYTKLDSIYDLPDAYRNHDILITQYVYLTAMADYIQRGGESRGSYLVYKEEGILPKQGVDESFRYTLAEESWNRKIQEVFYKEEVCTCTWIEARPIPSKENWFETVWNAYRNHEFFKK